MRSGLLARAMSTGTLTKQYVTDLFHNLETGQAAEFVSHIADNVDWTIKGTHPLAGHYSSKKAFQVGTARRSRSREHASGMPPACQRCPPKAHLLSPHLAVSVCACQHACVDGIKQPRIALPGSLQEGALAKIGSGLKEPLRMKVTSILVDGDWAAVEMSAVNAVSKQGWPFDNEYCWVCRFEQVTPLMGFKFCKSS